MNTSTIIKKPFTSLLIIFGIFASIAIFHYDVFHPIIDRGGVYFLLAVCDITYDRTNSLATIHRCAGCGTEINSTVCVSYSKIGYLDDIINNMTKGTGVLEASTSSNLIQHSGEYRVVAYIPAHYIYPKYKFDIREVLDRSDKDILYIVNEKFRGR